MNLGPRGIDLGEFFAQRAALLRQATSSNSDDSEESRENKRTIELTAEEAIALGMIQGSAGGSFHIEDAVQDEDIMVQQMDIAEPLTTLRALLERRLGVKMDSYEFWLQNQQILDPNKNLVEQCVQGDGVVQINCEVGKFPGASKPRINIVDILKPAEEFAEVKNGHDTPARFPTSSSSKRPSSRTRKDSGEKTPDDQEEVTRWVVDKHFRNEQERLGIPMDPRHWTSAHVRYWLRWALDKFRLEGVDANEWSHMTGQDLAEIDHVMFTALVPNDKDDLFWTHLELLRKCKFVAIIQVQPKNSKSSTSSNVRSSAVFPEREISVQSTSVPPHTSHYDASARSPAILSFPSHASSHIHITNNNNNNNYKNTVTNNNYDWGAPGGSVSSTAVGTANKNANNGQIQLWQFLLELLTDHSCRDAIHWLGEEGEFKLQNPELVAQMWGKRKKKPTMNYDKLSRALRYYYDGDMITKVHGKRFVYKFVCDLKSLLGFSPKELAALVQQCAKKANQTDQMRDRHIPGDDSLDESEEAALALRRAVVKLGQLSATGGHVGPGGMMSPALKGPSFPSSSFPSTSSSSSGPRIVVRRPAVPPPLPVADLTQFQGADNG